MQKLKSIIYIRRLMFKNKDTTEKIKSYFVTYRTFDNNL